MDAAPDTEALILGDPTQRLLTALGRFQRQLAKAESGAPQETWTDECMAQLIAGVEISAGQGWKDVQRALTDTARVLQTYEDAGHATECGRFLQESYEILCLMVGDLIVDNIRSGVMKKWDACYDRAVAELGKAGLTLVEDETMEAAPRLEPVAETASETVEESPFALPEDATGETEAGEDFDSVLEAAVDIMADPAGAETETEAAAEDKTAAPDAAAEAVASKGACSEGVFFSGGERLIGRGTEEAEASSAEAAVEIPKEDRVEDAASTQNLIQFPGEMAQTAPDAEHEAAEAAEPEAGAETEIPEARAETPVIEEQAQPVPVLPDQDTAAAPEPPEEAVAVPGGDVMREAQEAMLRGDVKNAKQLALQLAVDMARLEVESARKELGAAEARLSEHHAGIEGAEEDVLEVKNALEEIQRAQADQNTEQERQREEIEDLRGNMSLIEGAIADIEAQIRALEEKREAERERLGPVHAALEAGLSGERAIHETLDRLSNSETAARERLEEACGQVAGLRERHSEEEQVLEQRRRELDERGSAASDIARLLEPPAESESQDEMLF